jgi:hypothetical protein
MAALTANNPQAQTNPKGYLQYPVKGSTHIYQGARVMVVQGTGYAIPAANTSGGVYVGIARNEVNNLGADGTMLVDVDPPGGIETINCGSTVTQAATVGVHVFLTDDQTVDIAANASQKVSFGVVTKRLSATVVQVDTSARFTLATIA